MSFNDLCSDSHYKGKLCWISVLINHEHDIQFNPNPTDIQDDIAICHDCQVFKELTSRGFGRRAADHAIMVTIIKLLEQLTIKQRNLQRTTNELKNSLDKLTLLNSITDTLARSVTLEKSLKIILTGATSGDAFSFNRAGVFLINRNTNMLEGKCAIGPENNEEANRIWQEISKIPISRLLEEILMEDQFVPCSLETLVSEVRIPLDEHSHPLIEVLDKTEDKIVDFQQLSEDGFSFSWWPNRVRLAVAPLIAEGRPLGIIIADNVITGEPITEDSLTELKSLANACSPGLQMAILHERLQTKIKELERMNQLIKENQAYLMFRERLADIGTLATKVAHEFRIPLVTIGGYARRILKTIGTEKFDKKLIEVIIAEVDRLTSISSEILEYSRLSKLNYKDCDINELIHESLSLLKNKINSCGIETALKFDRKKLYVKGDPERLKQVILNIVDNAADAMEHGGQLTVRTVKNKEYIMLDIEDTGQGIDKIGLENLFNLFYTTKNKGTGLGLPVSKKIIDDHGGYINVSSGNRGGSVFSIRLPAVDTHEG